MSDDTPDVELWQHPEDGPETLLYSSEAECGWLELRGAVPIEELEALVFEWLHNGYDQTHPNSEVAHAINRKRANELQEVIDQYE